MRGAAGGTWAGSHTFAAERLERPGSVEEVQRLVASTPRVRALGTRHSFTDLADTDGVLVALDGLPRRLELDEQACTATVAAGLRYGDVARWLQERGWALANLASLPHIGVAGAVATGTHGSGVGNQTLSAAVAALELVDGRGELRRLRRGDPGFDGCVVALGALGVVTALTLDVVPSFTLSQQVFTDLPWEPVERHLDDVLAGGYSVSLFTAYGDDGVRQAWVKSLPGGQQGRLLGRPPAARQLHMLEGAPAEATTEQLGRPGPWLDRLPHFRMELTPSRGEELQSEYLVPRRSARAALEELRRLAPRFQPVLQVSEIRTVAADTLWLSGAGGEDVVGFHFTWAPDRAGVYAVLPALEAALLPLGGRPHWGKCFVAQAAELAPLYPRLDDFRGLRAELDPDGRFDNGFLRRVLGPAS